MTGEATLCDHEGGRVPTCAPPRTYARIEKKKTDEGEPRWRGEEGGHDHAQRLRAARRMPESED
jgi:hypothetical protein